MQAYAIARYVRLSPKKGKWVARLIQGKSAQEAINILSMLHKKAARLLFRVLRSAVANYQHLYKELPLSELKVKLAQINQAGMRKIIWARAKGRATLIRRRFSHIKVVVEDGSES